MKENYSKEKFSFVKLLSEWGLFTIALLVIISYTVITSQPDSIIEEGVWENILFTVINLLAAFYISRQVALWGWRTDNAKNQKKIAKTAIRHNRGNLTSIIKIIKITKEKIELIEDPLTKQYLTEIRNHLVMIYNGIRNSEADFNEIVNEELKEQNFLEIEISDVLDEIDQKNKELEELEGQAQADKDTINKLKATIKEKESELSTKVSNLPFGSNSFLSGSTYNFLERKDSDIYTINKGQLEFYDLLSGQKEDRK